MKLIPLTQGKFAMVDDEDFELLNQFKWYAKKDPFTWYAVREVSYSRKDRRQSYMHRILIPGYPEVDYINMCGLDNRKTNLRPSEHKGNRRNRIKIRRKTLSRFKGVTLKIFKSGNQKWSARCATKKGRSRKLGDTEREFLGYFHDEIDAAKAYDRAARRNFGDFARLNFPENMEPSALISLADVRGIS